MTAPAVLVAAVLMASAPALAQTTVAGVTSGALSVDETGSAGYTIPIAVPPGIAGMQPSLALVYKSHGGNGTAGVGWSLSASSSIHRCSQTLVQDGAIHGVDFSAEDRFCLDGQRLVAVSGAYGADGTEYRTEIDGFARVISHGVAGSGPERFTVESKSGQTLDYGNTTDSRLGVPGASEVRLWSLSRVTDPSGNAMTYHYIEDPADKSYRLDKVAYAYDAAVTTAKSEVRFLYEARPDTRTSYLAGAELAMTQRLSKIETWTDASTGLALVKDYRLTYELSPATSRSRITSIKECDASDNCLQPVQLEWSTGTAGFALSAAHELPETIYNGSNKQRGDLVDVNGDGMDDFVIAYHNNLGATYKKTFRSTGDGWAESSEYLMPTPIHNAGLNKRQGEFIDVNGDGLIDWLEGYSTTTNTYLNTGNGWTLDAGYELPESIYNGNYKQRGEFVDVNGDSLPDFVVAYHNNLGSIYKVTYLNTGSGWSASPAHELPTPIFNAGLSLREGQFIDVNGDGLADWVQAYTTLEDTYVSYRSTYLSTGSGWSLSAAHQLPTSIISTTGGHRGGLFADVNGDGLQDWVYAIGSVKKTYISTGGGWLLSAAHQLPNPIYNNVGRQLGEFTDTNGDGLPDWIRAYTTLEATYVSYRSTYLSTGSGWSLSSVNQLPTSIFNETNGHRGGLFADVNGDGLQDWVYAIDTVKKTYISGHPTPDLLTSVTDSLGRVSTIAYKPLTDNTVYSKDSDAVFPVVDIQAPLYVVKSVSSDDGLGGQAVTSYGYAGAKVHVQGRGFRGFRQMTATDEKTGIVTTTDYHQVFPYTAQVTQSVKTLADGTTIKTIDNTWDQLSLNGGNTVYPYVASSTSEDYEINDGLGNSPVVSRTASAVFDTYGNPTSLTTTTTGGGESFTETTVNTYDNDTTNWFLGLLRRSEVTRSRGTP